MRGKPLIVEGVARDRQKDFRSLSPSLVLHGQFSPSLPAGTPTCWKSQKLVTKPGIPRLLRYRLLLRDGPIDELPSWAAKPEPRVWRFFLGRREGIFPGKDELEEVALAR